MDKRQMCIAALFLCAAAALCAADRAAMSFREDFEQGADPVKLWRTNTGRYTVNFKGLTREKKSSGRSAFKLDITVKEGSYAHWWIPLKVFSEGRLKFSGRVLVDDQTNGTVRFGPVYGIIPDFPAYDGLNSLLPVCAGGKDWTLVECDVAEMGRNLVKSKLPGLAWGVKEENTGSYLEGLCLYLEPPVGGAGRFVVYLDDVRVEGDTVPVERYVAGVEKRWEPARAAIKDKLDSWDRMIEAKEGLATSEEMKAKIPHIKRRIITARCCGFIPPEQTAEMAGYFQEIDQSIKGGK